MIEPNENGSITTQEQPAISESGESPQMIPQQMSAAPVAPKMKPIYGALLGLVVVAAVGAFLLTRSQQPPVANNDASEQRSPQTATEASASLNSTGFSPATIAVAAGSTVTWTNTDTANHTFSCTDADSELCDDLELKPNDTISLNFDIPGTYNFQSKSGSKTFTAVVTVQ